MNWEAHLETLPLATWIVRFDAEPSQSQNQYLSPTEQCGPVFANRACREALGITAEHAQTGRWLRYLHPEDRQTTLVAWSDFLSGRSDRFQRLLRWIRPDTKEIISLAVRAQKLHCGDIQGWLRTASMEDAISRLEELAYA